VIAAGLDPDEVVRHPLRHTAITRLVQLGVDLPTWENAVGGGAGVRDRGAGRVEGEVVGDAIACHGSISRFPRNDIFGFGHAEIPA
jgi:hypothetical protein